jgi:hypothetical protein
VQVDAEMIGRRTYVDNMEKVQGCLPSEMLKGKKCHPEDGGSTLIRKVGIKSVSCMAQEFKDRRLSNTHSESLKN